MTSSLVSPSASRTRNAFSLHPPIVSGMVQSKPAAFSASSSETYSVHGFGICVLSVCVCSAAGGSSARSVFAAVLNLGFVLFSAQLPLVTGNLHSVVDCALIGLALSAFRSETLLRDTAAPVPQIPEKETV